MKNLEVTMLARCVIAALLLISIGSSQVVAEPPSPTSVFQLILDWQMGDTDFARLLDLIAGLEPMAATMEIEIPGLSGGARPLVLTLVNGGSFVMGSPPGRSWADDNEFPQHLVTITKDLYFSETEITQAQYLAVVGQYGVGEEPTAQYGLGENVPVYGLSWISARLFVDAINNLELTEGTFRLPTEAEWEYACRGGTEGRYYFADDDGDCFDPMLPAEYEGCGAILTENVWWLGSFPPPPPVTAKAQPVALFDPNPFGLYDMTGNVNEWCEDRYLFDWYSRPEASGDDPINTDMGDSRVLRGGSWSAGPDELHSSHRIQQEANIVGRIVGIRLVLEK
ncbi:MAG: formylglycine-generating enzyme family protein [Candidatus Omnitrophica bacterium]|nr:formylglycine-generating enzyme family protein [Candidatus Omnitrophota bacterium]